MRDQLEDAHRHRDDGYGRAQHLNKVELPTRFYKEVGVGSAPGGYSVTLDGKTPRTPGQVSTATRSPSSELERNFAGTNTVSPASVATKP